MQAVRKPAHGCTVHSTRTQIIPADQSLSVHRTRSLGVLRSRGRLPRAEVERGV